MAEGAVEILTDPRLHTAMAEAGRRIAVERFSAASVVPRYEAVYDRMLSGSGR